MVGGDLHWLWKPYEMYANVDHVRLARVLQQYTFLKPFFILQVYGVKAFENGEGFANAAGSYPYQHRPSKFLDGTWGI